MDNAHGSHGGHNYTPPERLAWNLDNHRTSTGTRYRHNHRGSSSISHMRSGRLHESSTTRRRRVLRLHKRMIHAPEEVMCYAVQGTNPLWKNTNVTVRNIRTVFKHSPCLICALAKKRKEGMAQWKPRKKYKKLLRIGKEQSDTKD